LKTVATAANSLIISFNIIMLSLLLPFLSFGGVNAYGGVDVSQRTYTNNWSCMVSNGKTFAIIRVYQSNGIPDPNGPYSINDAWSGGMSYVDGYIFPCYSCGNPAKQVPQNFTQEYMSIYSCVDG
jgi:hypothetical protein